MSAIYILASLQILIYSCSTITSLPVTSKPIENTPENLAWEAWIMVQSPNGKTKKITPKSIFILPNKTNGGYGSGSSTITKPIECPTGHRIDNNKCIPIINIDRNEILITQLTNLIHSTDKYGNNKETSSSYEYDYDYEETYEPGQSEPFIQDNINNNNEPFKIKLSLDRLTALDDNLDTTFDEQLKLKTFDIITTTTTTTTSENKNDNIKQNLTIIPNHIVTDILNSTKINGTEIGGLIKIPIISSTEAEILSLNINNNNDNITEIILNDDIQTTTYNPDLEIITEIKLEQSNLTEVLLEESLVLENDSIDLNDTQNIETTDINDDMITTQQYNITDEILNNNPPIINSTMTVSQVVEKISKILSTVSMENLNNSIIINETIDNIKSNDYDQINNQNNDTDDIIEINKNNNRFIYHHLGSLSLSTTSKTTPTTTTTSSTSTERTNQNELTPNEMNEHLRLINKIVEDNKKRNNNNNNIFNKNEQIDLSMKSTTPKIPLWWLPTEWESDNNGQKPLLLRFWSRKPNEQIKYQKPLIPFDSLTTTSGYRENSRSPTENLYKEISAQEVYKVLAAKNWKQNNR